MTTVGLIANPLAGKDVRRFISAASLNSDRSKIEILKRGTLISVVGKLGVNDFNGYQTIEMNLEDLFLPCP